jgi:hypothetical protein
MLNVLIQQYTPVLGSGINALPIHAAGLSGFNRPD